VLDAVPDLAGTLDYIKAEGDKVSTFGRMNGTFSGEDNFGKPANGNPFTIAVADVFRISDGQISEHFHVGDYSNFPG